MVKTTSNGNRFKRKRLRSPSNPITRRGPEHQEIRVHRHTYTRWEKERGKERLVPEKKLISELYRTLQAAEPPGRNSGSKGTTVLSLHTFLSLCCSLSRRTHKKEQSSNNGGVTASSWFAVCTVRVRDSNYTIDQTLINMPWWVKTLMGLYMCNGGCLVMHKIGFCRVRTKQGKRDRNSFNNATVPPPCLSLSLIMRFLFCFDIEHLLHSAPLDFMIFYCNLCRWMHKQEARAKKDMLGAMTIRVSQDFCTSLFFLSPIIWHSLCIGTGISTSTGRINKRSLLPRPTQDAIS